MKQTETGSRRDFIRKISLSGVVTIGLPDLLTAKNGEQREKQMKEENLVFLFQGDSITDGNRGRDTDPNHILGHGYVFNIGSQIGADFPEKHLKFYNRGISGHKITDLAARWQQDTIDIKPDVLSIMVGINDTNSVVDRRNIVTVEEYEKVYRSLLETTRQKFPEILFVLCESFILPVGKVKDNWEAWHSDVVKRQEIVRRLAGDYNAVFVGLQSVFDKACDRAPADYWIWDGIHPTYSGHELVAREWLKQTGKRLPFLSK